jgi:hypothetical protein
MSDPASLQSAISKYLTYRPVSVGMIAQKLGMPAPVSVRDLMGQLNGIPETRVFKQDIVTPSGTPLGGSVTLILNRNGSYTVEFQMHSSSILASFDFQLRAYLQGPGLPVLFFYHAGHVSPEGTDDTHPEPGSNPLIQMYWDQIVKTATFSVANDYQWSGVAGGIANLLTDIIDLGAAAAGAAVGAVIGLTSEAIGFLGATLGVGGTLGVIAGVVVFAVGALSGLGAGSALILGTVVGVVGDLITNALIQHRQMNEDEIATAQEVFAGQLPYDRVVFTNLSTFGGRQFTAPGVDGKIYCNLGPAYDNPLGFASGAYPAAGEVMIHELTHAWQIANNSFLPGFVCSGVVNQTHYLMGDDVYAYGPAGPAWSDLNLEQQGQIVNQWFAGSEDSGGHQSQWLPMNRTENPYFRYISGNILTGSAGFSTDWL